MNPALVLLEVTPPSLTTITDAFGTAVNSMATNIVTLIGAGLPYVAPVAGVGIAISFAWSVVRRFTR